MGFVAIINSSSSYITNYNRADCKIGLARKTATGCVIYVSQWLYSCGVRPQIMASWRGNTFVRFMHYCKCSNFVVNCALVFVPAFVVACVTLFGSDLQLHVTWPPICSSSCSCMNYPSLFVLGTRMLAVGSSMIIFRFNFTHAGSHHQPSISLNPGIGGWRTADVYQCTDIQHGRLHCKFCST